MSEFIIQVGEDWDGVLILFNELCIRCHSSNKYAVEKNKREGYAEYQCRCAHCGNRMHILKEVRE